MKTTPPDRKWLRLARQRGFTLRTGEPEHRPLKKILLSIGGWGVCINREPDLEKIVARGRMFPGRSKMMKGEPCRCHSNSAACWDENRELCRICTGYALTRDGMWRQHSWVYTNNGVVVETTLRRIAYWGFVLTEEECEAFLADNW